MAANVPVPTTAKEAPLASFERVSKIAYLYRPNADRNPSGTLVSGGGISTSISPSSPRLILVGGWMDAREPHLAKYTAKLQFLYPDSPILLIRSFAYHFTGSRFPTEIEPAIPLIRSLVSSEDHGVGAGGGGGGEQQPKGQKPQMLVHLFSNGGSAMLRFLYEAYARSARPGEPARLPAHVTVFDSAPGRFSWRRSVTAFTLPFLRANILVRAFWRAVINALCAFYWVLHVPWGRPGFLDQTWAVHNERATNAAEVRRVYIYSEEDQLVEYRDVEEHAAVGRQRGFEARLEKFKGTAHVAHARGDEERYWSIVKSTWEGRA